MTDHILERAKAYAALIGSLLTVLGSTLPPDPTVQKWLGVALALCTAVATFAVPNKPKALAARPYHDPDVKPFHDPDSTDQPVA